MSSAVGRDWQWAAADAACVPGPSPELDRLSFVPAPVPGTVAEALSACGSLDLEHPPAFDGLDHFYRTRLRRASGHHRHVLVFEGLATLADAWLDDRLILSSDNMFRRHEVDVTDLLEREESVLTLRFRSVEKALAQRRPRPRWRTRVVPHQQLRWIRTSLIGRTPGFCPSVPIVGPYRPVRLEQRSRWSAIRSRVAAAVRDGQGRVRVSLELEGLVAGAPDSARARLTGAAGGGETVLESSVIDGGVRLEAELSVADTHLWWPNGYGDQPLSALEVELRYPDGSERIELGRVGFRKLECDPDQSRFGIAINGVRIFCRGACWTAHDLSAPEADPRPTLDLARRAGANMLRVGGTTLYESDAFYDACDELGILVWQDFMFANMEYPTRDTAFAENVRAEVVDQLTRLAPRPSLAVLCGGSEIQQQAAMLGLSAEERKSPLFDELLPDLVREYAPSVPYLPSTPTGGTLPFHTPAGVTHYYGYGAYLRDCADIRASDVGFAAECLAFANVPETATLESFLRDLEIPPHHPRWKARVPRDRGAGWDFDDVRDWYVGKLFGVDPMLVRYSDVERYLALGRAATADAMERVFSEWRRSGSRCRGGLVWFLKDFWAGAGWGVIDARGMPKSAYYALKRVWSPIALLCIDEGLNGHVLHVVNDTALALAARIEVVLYRDGQTEVGRGSTGIEVPARGAREVSVDALLGQFHDTTYAYRFGPAGGDVLVARLIARDSEAVLGRCFAFPIGPARSVATDIGLSAAFDADGGMTVTASRFAYAVHVEVPGCLSEDDYFHLAPGETRRIALEGAERPTRGWVSALNCRNSATITAAVGSASS